jgi:hypothetical protein
MAQKMQAAVVVAFGQPLELREYDIPTAGPGQILVKTEACGVCHTDLHAARGDWPLKPFPLYCIVAILVIMTNSDRSCDPLRSSKRTVVQAYFGYVPTLNGEISLADEGADFDLLAFPDRRFGAC